MKKIVYSLSFVTAFLAAAAASALIFKYHVPVGGLVKTVGAIVNIATDRNVEIAGSYYIVPGAWLQLVCENGEITVHDPHGGYVTTTMAHASTSIRLRTLLKKQVELDYLLARGINIELSSHPNGMAGKAADEKYDPAMLQGYSQLLKKIGKVDGGDIHLTVIHGESASPFVCHLDTLIGSVGENIPGQLHAEGIVQSQRIGVNLHIDPLEYLASDNMLFKYSAEIQYLDADVLLEGGIANGEAGYQLDSHFNLKDLAFSKIGSLFGPPSHNDRHDDVLFSCNGRLALSPEKMTVRLDNLLPGTENLSVTLSVEGGVSGTPIFISSITGELLDIDDLMSAAGAGNRRKTARDVKPEGNESYREIVIFPEMLAGKSFDLTFDVAKTIVAGREITGLNTHAVMKNGVIVDAPFSAALADFSLGGRYSLDAAAEIPRFQLQYTTNSWNLGATLTATGVAEDVKLTIAQSSCKYKTSGRKLSELVNNLEFTINGNNGLLQLPDHNTGAILPVNIEAFTLVGKPGEETTLQLDGQVAGNRIGVTAAIADKRGVPLADIGSVAFHMAVEREGARFKAEGTLPVPFNFVGTAINYNLSGSDIKTVEDITSLDLQFTGPYRFTGNLHIIPEGYHVHNLELAIGRSLLKGELGVDTKVSRPTLSIDVDVLNFQLADLKRDSTVQDGTSALEDAVSESASKEQGVGADWTVPDNFDAAVKLRVKQLYSGDDYLGKGSITVELRSGKLSVAPVHMSLPAGEIDAQFSMEPAGNDRLFSLNVDVDKLDYGVVSRWFKPGTEQGGILSLRSALQGRVGDNEDLLAHGDGYIDFCLQPENFRAGVVDLWAINLVSYLVPIFMPTSESRLNCIAGRFNINDGKMKEDELLLDTSRIQVKGSMEVDFGRRWIEARLRPIPKRSQFYSLATPVQISGRLSDLKVGVAKGGLIGTVIRLLTSYVVVPVQWVTRQKVPVDGTGQCLQVYNQRAPGKP